MISPLDNLADSDKPLPAEPMDASEFEGLLRSGRVRLVDACNASLALHTLGPGSEVWRVLDKCHHMRNVAEYEEVLDVDERIATDLVATCERVADKLLHNDGTAAHRGSGG